MKVSKKLTWIVTVAMLINCLAVIPGFAQTGYSEGEFTKIYSFSDYTQAFKTTEQTLPDGMIAISMPGFRNTNQGYEDYEGIDRSSRVYKIADNAEPIVPFGTNFLDGYVHVSFDYRQVGKSMMSFMLARNTSTDTPTASSVGIDGQFYAEKTSFKQDEYDYTRFINGGYTRIFATGNASYEANPIKRSIWHNASGWGNTNNLRIGGADTVGQSMADTWYKVDVYLDRTTNNYYVYIDGTLADYKYGIDGNEVDSDVRQSSVDYAAAGNNAIKGIAFRHDALRNYNDVVAYAEGDSRTANDYVYLDNIYVNHYTSDDVKNDTIKLILDTLNKDTLAAGDKLSIGFSEALEAAPAKEDIVITDESGKAFTDFTVAADVAQATITLGSTIGTGKYTVTVKNVTGAISESSIDDEVTFTASSAPVNAAGTTFNYIDEDFEGLEEGVILPNWYYDDPDLASGVENSRYYTKRTPDYYAAKVMPEDRDGRTALKLSKDAADTDTELFYYFPSGTAKGSFKAEFDVKHENGGWTFGFINNTNYQASMYKFKYGYWNGYQFNEVKATSTVPTVSGITGDIDGADAQRQSILSGRAKQSVFLGMGNSTAALETATGGYAVRAMSPNLGIVGGKDVEAAATGAVNTRSETNNVEAIDGLTVTPGEWTKVEVSVNDNNKTYTITVTPYDSNGVLGTPVTKTVTDFAANRFIGGIMGIRISRNGANATEEIGDVCFDNIKVYKETTTYLDDDFNDYTTEGYGTARKQGPSGWQQWTDKTHTDTNFTVYENKNGLLGVTSVARKDTDSKVTDANDRAMHLYYNSPVVFKNLDTPVPAGQPFVIEFDVYNVGDTTKNTKTGQQNVWSFMQIGQEDTVILPTYNYPNTKTKAGKFSIAKNMFVDTANVPTVIDDTAVGTFKTDVTYSYITGDLMKNNVVFGRRNNGPDTPILHINSDGRGSVYSGGWSANALGFTATNGGSLPHALRVERFACDCGNCTVTPAWVNYKVICTPKSATETAYKITATHLDTGYSYTASFTNTRDWYTRDTHAIGFYANNYGSYATTSDGSVGNYFDNVKVYAVDAETANAVSEINLQSVAKIEAETASGVVTDVTNASELPKGTNKVSVTFTNPVNELLPQNASLYAETYGTGYTLAYSPEGNEDYTSVLTTIKDFIQLRKSGEQADCYTSVELANDNKTVVLTLEEAVNSRSKYTLGVNENISFTSGAYDKLASNFVQTWSVEQDAKTDIALTVERMTGTAYIPLNKSGVVKIAEGEDVRLRFTGYNATAGLPLLAAYSYYMTDDAAVRMLNYDGQDYTLNIGEVDQTLPVTVIPSDYSIFKAFLWNSETLTPFTDVYEH